MESSRERRHYIRSFGSPPRLWDVADETDDPTELAARRDDWETTKAHLNESHSSDRKLFP